MTAALGGTEGYAEEVDDLVRRYESITFAETHKAVLHLIPQQPCRVLDIGAGTGRDAAALAALGHRVVAAEPTAALRRRAADLHPSPRIEWLDDGLPELSALRGRGERFDLVMLTAVWMHLDAQQRRAAMATVAALMRERGVTILSLRHGPVPSGRRMFEVSAEETIALAEAQGLQPVLSLHEPSSQRVNRQAGVTWTRLAFRRSTAVCAVQGGDGLSTPPAPPSRRRT